MPEKAKQLFFGAFNAVKPEGQGKKMLEWYDKLRFPKLTNEEEKIKDKIHVALKNNPKLAGWGAIAGEAALLAGVVAGFRKFRKRDHSSVVMNSDSSAPSLNEASRTFEPSSPIVLPASKINEVSSRLDGLTYELHKMTAEIIAARIGNVEPILSEQGVTFRGDRLPPFFIHSLGERLLALPDDAARLALLAHTVADGEAIWSSFLRSNSDRSKWQIRVHNGMADFLEFDEFIADMFAPRYAQWFDRFLVRGFSTASDMLDAFARETGFSFRAWGQLNARNIMPDTIKDLIHWMVFVGESRSS